MAYQARASDLERVRCPLCCSDEPAPLHDFPPYQVVRCGACQLHYLSPRLVQSAMRRVYEDDSYFQDGGIGYKSYAQQELALRYSFRYFLQQLKKRRLTGGSLLEVGCGYGFLLDEAKDYFQYRVGIDYSDGVVENVGQRADRVYQGDINAIPAAEMFDCIILISVIEHVYTPVDFIRQLSAHLRPSGTVIIATPDVDGVYQRMLGTRWPAFQVIPEHVTFYNKKTLSLAMTKAGLKNIRSLPYRRTYPANLVIEEFNLWSLFLKPLGQRNVIFPGYMVALCGSNTA